MGDSSTQLKNARGFKFGGRKITSTMQKQAVSWAREEIITTELQRLWNEKHVSSCMYRAGSALREAFRSGLLK
jgi:hypothetical protein